MSKAKERLIINNRTDKPMLDILPHVSAVIRQGRISNNNNGYCYLTSFHDGVMVSAQQNNDSSDTLTVWGRMMSASAGKDKMNIGIWTDTELNLAAMKISAWHKAQGDSVERIFPMKQYDRIYACKIFGDEYTQLPDYAFNASEVICGGTGFDISVVNGREKFKHGEALPP
jgi:hypothetical protein